MKYLYYVLTTDTDIQYNCIPISSVLCTRILSYSGTHHLCLFCRPPAILLPHRNERLLLVRCQGKMREPTLDPVRRTDIRLRGNLYVKQTHICQIIL